MARVPLVVGNWKMNLTPVGAKALIGGIASDLAVLDSVEVVVCPPYLSIPAVHRQLKGTRIALGAQDVFWEETGAFTGKVNAAMLVDAGVTHCIVGHSECRGRFGKPQVAASTFSYFSDTDESVNLKVKALVFHAQTPIVCVGETLEERNAGKTDQVVKEQLEGAIRDVDPGELERLVVAYEPVWAIGTGKTCDPEEAQRICAKIRSQLEASWLGLGSETRILYGGSVTSANARSLFSKPDIDGGLIGGASLDVDQFVEIVRAAK